MNRNRPYLNRFVKRKEQEIEDSYHSANLREIKPITSKLMDHSETIVINRSKQEMIKEVRDIEIERENKMLLQKISSVMSKKGAYSVSKTKNIRTKVNKSLNQIYRKRQLEEIELENKRFVLRLQQKRPTLNIQKLNKDWLDNKNVIKRMANYEFNLTSIKSSSRVRSITLDKFYKSKYDRVKFSKMKLINGQKMLIRVEFTEELLKIIGDSQNNRDLKVIQIPRDEAITFIEKDCGGKLQNIIDKLMYDAESESLYLVSDQLQEVDFNEFNPQIDNFIAKKQQSKKQKKDNRNGGKNNKSSISHHQHIQEKDNNKGDKEPKPETIAVVQSKKQQTAFSPQKDLTIEQITPKNEQRILPSSSIQRQENAQPAQGQVIEGVEHKQNEIEQVIEKKEGQIQPQQDKYEEQKFQQSNNALKESKKKSEPQVVQQVVKAQPESIKPEIIVAPEDQENYNEEFQASGAVQSKVLEQKKIEQVNDLSN